MALVSPRRADRLPAAPPVSSRHEFPSASVGCRAHAMKAGLKGQISDKEFGMICAFLMLSEEKRLMCSCK
jgi:hypothetical protein